MKIRFFKIFKTFVVLKIFNLSSSALFHNKLKKFSEEPKLFVDLCHVKSDLKNIQFLHCSYFQNNSNFY